MSASLAAVVAVLVVVWPLLEGNVSWGPPRVSAQVAQDPVSVIQAHYAAWNVMDLPAVMAMFTDDIIVDDAGNIYIGTDQVAAWARRYLAPT